MNQDLTIAQISKWKSDAEKMIAGILSTLEKETGLEVKDILVLSARNKEFARPIVDRVIIEYKEIKL